MVQARDTLTAAALIQTGRLLVVGNPAFPRVFGTAVFNTVFGFSDEKLVDAGLFVAHFEPFFWTGRWHDSAVGRNRPGRFHRRNRYRTSGLTISECYLLLL